MTQPAIAPVPAAVPVPALSVHVVVTTHWDREWIQPLSQYRQRLVRLMDRLLDQLEREPGLVFTLDGQAVALEDYLEVRPEAEARLRAHLAAGRLVAGPWYVLADQFLEGDEAAIRNLQLGMAVVRRLGGRPMAHGYVPDSFGSIATLPMLLAGFGIAGANLGRGLTTEGSSDCFRWAWRDGSSVLAWGHGYGNGVGLGYPEHWRHLDHLDTAAADPAHGQRWADGFLASQTGRVPAPVRCASVGVDHLEPRTGTAAQVAQLDASTPHRWRCSTPEAFIAEVAERLDGQLETVVGEQRGDDRRPMDLQGVLSTDPVLKAANRQAELALVRVVEPLAVLRRAAGLPDEAHQLRMAWRTLLRCHPHDSICGCNVDRVVDEVRARARDAIDQADMLGERWLRDCIPNLPWRAGAPIGLVVLDPLVGRGADVQEVLVRVPAPVIHRSASVIDASGTVVGEARLVAHRQADLETSPATLAGLLAVRSKEPRVDGVPADVFSVLRLRLWSDGTAAGARRLQLAWWQPIARRTLEVDERRLANDRVAVGIADDGSLWLEDLASGRRWDGLAYLEDMADAGDSYDFGQVVGDQPLRSRGAARWTSRVLHRDESSATLRLTLAWSLPERLEEGARRERRERWPYGVRPQVCRRSGATVPMTAELDITLVAGSSRVACRLSVDNRADHHRLRVAFAAPTRPDLHAGAHFSIQPRPWRGDDVPFPVFPVLDWIHRSDGLAIIGRGLYDGAARPLPDGGGEVLLTVLRSVDTIGPAAGMNFDVERVRCLGQHVADFALVPASSPLDAQRAANAWLTPMVGEGVNADPKEPITGVPDVLLASSDESLVVSAIKPAEDGSGVIVRLWNPGSEARTTTLRLGVPWTDATAVRLDESPTDSPRLAAADDGSVSVSVQPWSTTTVRFGRPSLA